MKKIYQKYLLLIRKLKDLPLLFLRLILAYGFLEPALMKIRGLHGVAEWFDSMNYPLPFMSALISVITESLGIILLTLGLGTRIISVPLMFIMVVAATTVHWSNGFAAGDNGFEIPLYYFFMLFTLLVYGSGRYSLDYLLFGKNKQQMQA